MEDFLDIKQGLQNIRFPSLIMRSLCFKYKIEIKLDTIIKE